ncbi:MAG: L-threonylcarbamoyladenylate synthase [Candidatus Woesearchaeota archaeon]|nr:L-threonylcarbamoyladenylate synthase [Candidatus Woesearchaeota archaeon]
MKTLVRKATAANISLAAHMLSHGQLVAFPTETVYGLGANALDNNAVAKIFAAKKRPANDPLIVHVASQKMIKQVVAEVSPLAKKLMKKYWPGPLTLLFPKHKNLPLTVTAGLSTVAVRMPSHSVALALIKKSNVPLAAPSANLFGRPSPTTASHVLNDLKNRIPLILDGGHTVIGVESTILSLAEPCILRPGPITFEELKKLLPNLKEKVTGPARAPGMLGKHYAPKTKVCLDNVLNLQGYQQKDQQGSGVLCTNPKHKHSVPSVYIGSKPEQEAKKLYAGLSALDKKGLRCIFVEPVSKKGIGRAVLDRLQRAAKE